MHAHGDRHDRHSIRGFATDQSVGRFWFWVNVGLDFGLCFGLWFWAWFWALGFLDFGIFVGAASVLPLTGGAFFWNFAPGVIRKFLVEYFKLAQQFKPT